MIFDGSTQQAEALVIIVCFISPEFASKQLLVQFHVLSKSLSGQQLSSAPRIPRIMLANSSTHTPSIRSPTGGSHCSVTAQESNFFEKRQLVKPSSLTVREGGGAGGKF